MQGVCAHTQQQRRIRTERERERDEMGPSMKKDSNVDFALIRARADGRYVNGDFVASLVEWREHRVPQCHREFLVCEDRRVVAIEARDVLRRERAQVRSVAEFMEGHAKGI